MVATKSLLRRGEAREYLGVSDWRFRRLLRLGKLVPRRWAGLGRAVYVREELDWVRRRLATMDRTGDRRFKQVWINTTTVVAARELT